jgi:sarcosine oxidase, subunit gamma
VTAEPTATGPLARTSPLRSWSERFAALPDSVQIVPEPYVAMAGLRIDPERAGAVATHLGVTLPGPSSWVESDAARVIWLGPDEFLVTTPFRGPGELVAGLRAAVGGAGAVVDVSAQRTTLALHGDHVRDVLATGCALDLHPRVFGTGSAAQTTLGLAGVVLLALDGTGTRYELLVRTSFARYLADWLLDAAVEFGTGSGTGNTDPGRGA